MSEQEFVHFETTRWGDLERLHGPDADAALASLCQRYWQPLYAFARQRSHAVHDAQDLTQAFFQHILSNHALRQADRSRGRFRTFLLTAFKNFAANESARSAAIKRGGSHAHLSLDFGEAEKTFLEAKLHHATPEQQFERTWTLKLLHIVRETLRDEYEAQGQSDRFAVFEPFLVTEMDANRAEAAKKLGLSQPAFRKAISRLRQRFRDTLKMEVSQLVHDPADIDNEIESMFQSLS